MLIVERLIMVCHLPLPVCFRPYGGDPSCTYGGHLPLLPPWLGLLLSFKPLITQAACNLASVLHGCHIIQQQASFRWLPRPPVPNSKEMGAMAP
jgi:hypothetical protein